MKKYLPLLAAALALTDDGRVLVTDGYVQRDGYPADAYSLIDLDAYLSGSTDYTPVTMYTGK